MDGHIVLLKKRQENTTARHDHSSIAPHRAARLLTQLCWVALLSTWTMHLGCVQSAYRYGISKQELIPTLPRTPNLITMGGHHPNVDAIERTFKSPGRAFRKRFPSKDPFDRLPEEDRRMQSVATASNYLDENGLKGVYIDVHEYNPREQWNRLTNNDRVSPFWKYTIGSIYHVGYTLLPGRALGFDQYNTFTNTLSINSTNPDSALFNAGYVKKLYDQRYPGTYVAANWLPIVPLFRDTSVSNDVLTYAHFKQDWKLKSDLYPQIYGRLGGDVVGQATSFIPSMAYMPFYMTPLLRGTGRLAGNATGNFIAESEKKERSGTIAR